MSPCILIMAGGTGGHVFPALAVAHELQRRGAEVVWLGTRRGIEADVVPKAGIDIEWISIAGLRGNGLIGWVFAPFRLGIALMQSLVVILHRRPAAVLGMGGFASGPGGAMTWFLHKPLVIHEQNAVAGVTNKILSRLAGTVMEAFPGTFKKSKASLCVGNPIRFDIAQIASPAERFAKRDSALRLLVLGGSLGAQALNDVLPKALAMLSQEQRPNIWHQAGRRNIEVTREAYAQAGVDGRVDAFIDDMAEAYAWADVVICRAGALTIAELASAGVGSMLVPYPHAVDDHQTVNAAYLAEADAAKVIQQQDLEAGALAAQISAWVDDAAHGRNQLLKMAEAARALAKNKAASDVADALMEAANG